MVLSRVLEPGKDAEGTFPMVCPVLGLEPHHGKEIILTQWWWGWPGPSYQSLGRLKRVSASWTVEQHWCEIGHKQGDCFNK